jgi:hypothetical protein
MTARRRGGIPPIVTVLITISAVVAAGLVAYFLFSTTSSATKQPMLEVTSAYAICPSASSCTVYVTIRNVGTVNVTITSVSYFDVSGVTVSSHSWYSPNNQLISNSNPVAIPAGGSAYLKGSVAVSGTTTGIPDGAGAALSLTVQPAGGSQQSLSLAFKIARQ